MPYPSFILRSVAFYVLGDVYITLLQKPHTA